MTRADVLKLYRRVRSINYATIDTCELLCHFGGVCQSRVVNLRKTEMYADAKTNKQTLMKKDWTLLVIDAAKQKALTPIQLQKALFLLGQKLPETIRPGFYEFVPYNFGPFSKEIYLDAEGLQDEGFVEQILKPGQNWPEYSISFTGSERASELRRDLSEPVREYLDKLVQWVANQSFQNLLHAVYKAYPEYATNSVFNVE